MWQTDRHTDGRTRVSTLYTALMPGSKKKLAIVTPGLQHFRAMTKSETATYRVYVRL